jgi:arylsulfatase A-like enzyme
MKPAAFLCVLFFTASLYAAERFNVVMVEADDLNPMALGYMGHRVVKTPHLDRLAAQGTVFKNCIVQGTACAPSRNSLISGTYPHNTGIYMNASPAGLPENCWTFPAALRRAGIYTALYGKNHYRPFGINPRDSYEKQNQVIRDQLGFDHAFSMGGKVALSARKHPPEKDPYAKYLHDKGIYDKLVAAYTEKRRGIDVDFPLDDEDYLDSFIINSAIKWIDAKEARKDPFFLWIDLTLPHPPMDVPQKYKDLYKDADLDPVIPGRKAGLPASLANDMNLSRADSTSYRRGYLALITMMDALVGRLVDHLDESGLRENTIVIFIADQGSMTGHHGLYSKKYFYKEVINSPTIISHPKHGQGKVITRPVELLDISKTMVTLYGCDPKDLAQTHGYDLMPLLKGGAFERKYAHAEQHGVNMIQNERFKLVTYEDGEILYDLKNDPDELTNAIGKHSEVAKTLRRKRDHWLANSGEVKPSELRAAKGRPKKK